MNAEPILVLIARLLAKHRLDAVMVGNAAAALQGAPVTTEDFDFLIRPTPLNVSKAQHIAEELGTSLQRPYEPASELYRIAVPSKHIQIDFMIRISGLRSFEGLRSRASLVKFDGHPLRVASLDDIIKSKEAAGREKDLAVMPILRRTVKERNAMYRVKKRGHGRAKA